MMYERLEYIMAIAEERNLTRAAKRLFISQPALTLYLSRLEAELGVKLFDRSRSPLVITEAGSFFIEKMKPIYYAEQMLRNDIRMVAMSSRTLTIGIGQVRGHHWLPLILPEFCRRYPHINLEITQTAEQDMVHLLKSGAIDVAFGVLPILSDEVQTIDLMQEHMVFTAHKHFSLVPRETGVTTSPFTPYRIEAEALNMLPFIRPRVSNGLYGSYEKIMTENKITPARTISVSNLSTGFCLAREGLGVQLISAAVLREYLCEEACLSDMDFCTLDRMPETRKCIAAYQKQTTKQDLICCAIDIIRKKILPDTRFTTACNQDEATE